MLARRYSENSASKARLEGVGVYRRLMFTLLSKEEEANDSAVFKDQTFGS
jgi:hypothetical protein